MKKSQIRIITISIILAVIAVAGYQLTGSSSISTTLSIQFDGIEHGLNPDDTRFDYTDIISEEALKAVATASGLTYNDALKSLVDIQPILPSNIVSDIEARRIAGESYTYFPNEFKITIRTDEALGIDEEVALTYLEAYKTGYTDHFQSRFKYPFVAISEMASYFDYSTYDYPELTKVFDNEFNMISSYINVLISDDPDYVSKQGHTFTDIKETINISKKLDMDQIDAYVNAYELTNDIDKLILKYEYMIRRYERDMNKASNQYTASESFVTLLEGKKATMLLPSANGEMITVSQLDSSYDGIAQSATEFKLSSGSYAEEIKRLESEVADLYDAVPDTAEIRVAKEQVDALVVRLNTKIENWTSLIEVTAEDYFVDKYRNAITLVDAAEVRSNRSSKVSLVLGFGVLLMSLFALMMFKRK